MLPLSCRFARFIPLLLATLALPVGAELTSLDDDSLSAVTGQAYIQIDQYQRPDDITVDYVRTQLGMDIELQTSADLLELGRYPRWDAKRNDWEVQPADIIIENYAMGHIYDESFYQRNPMIPRPRRDDGSRYQNGDIVPFRIIDPYIELAYETLNGQVTPVGVRIGFGQAEGSLSGNIISLTGNVYSTVRTNLDYLTRQAGGCNLAVDLCSLLGLNPLLGQVELINPAELVYGKLDSTPADLVGELDEARAMFTGIKNGDSMTVRVGPASASVEAQHCQVLAADVCFPLTNFQSLWIGQRDAHGNPAGPADGMYLSFQSRALAWNRDYRNGNTDQQYMQTVMGAFLNIPKGALELDTVSAMQGTQRVRTEYIDRGVGLF